MAMTLRENSLAILRYENYEKLPIVNFGYWGETLQKWVQEGHLTQDEIQNAWDGSENDRRIGRKLGFDFNWNSCFGGSCGIQPGFEQKVLEVREDGSKIMVDSNGVIVKVKDSIVSIPTEIDHMLKDRESWERDFKHRLQYSESRINLDALAKIPRPEERETPLGIHCGSLFGEIRNILGVEGTSYVYCDDEELYDEIIDTVGELCYRVAKRILESGVQFDFGHFWEDICFKNGPLVIPSVFAEKVGPHYKKITELLRRAQYRHRKSGLRWQDRCADSHLAGEWSEHHVPHRGRNVGGQHRAVEREVWKRNPRSGWNEQNGVSPRITRRWTEKWSALSL